MKKECGHCHMIKDVSQFQHNRSTKSGYSSYCKDCCKKYRDSNREYYRAIWKQYYNKHRNELLEKDRTRRKKNIDKEREYGKEYRSRPDVIKRKRAWWKKYSAERLENDALYAMRMWIRRETRRAALSPIQHINANLEPILGCDGSTFQEHLYDTWKNNYGESWNGQPFQIDHIVPLSSATTEEELLGLAHYSNVQMLTPEDNISKGDKNKV